MATTGRPLEGGMPNVVILLTLVAALTLFVVTVNELSKAKSAEKEADATGAAPAP